MSGLMSRRRIWNEDVVMRLKSLDVLAVGNAIVDIFARCDDAFLDRQGIGKSMMNLVDAERSAQLYGALDAPQEISGGSAANTIVGLSQLGVKVGYVGKVCVTNVWPTYNTAVTSTKRRICPRFVLFCTVFVLK